MQMTRDAEQGHRRSIRLPTHDYAGPGAYFVTLATYNRDCLFGHVIDGEVRLSAPGEVVAEEWRRTIKVRPQVELDVFIVMPNHLHGIVIVAGLQGHVGAHSSAPLRFHRPARSLGSLVAGFKGAVTKRINEIRGTPRLPVWQRNYYDHVIRDGEEMDRVRQYIASNPACWEHDRENPGYSPRNDQHAAREASQPWEHGRRHYG